MLSGLSVGLPLGLFSLSLAGADAAPSVPVAAPVPLSGVFQFEDGGVKDMSTGLVWVENVSSQWQWNQAGSVADSLLEGGFDDWLLPSKDEQITAAVNGIGQFVNNPHALSWSRDKKGNKAWATRLDSGVSTLFLKQSYMFVRPNRYAGPNSIEASAFSASEIDIWWQDNSESEDGFELDRSTDGVNWNLTISLGPNVTAYTDSGLAKRTTYFYRVRAIRAPGTLYPSDVGWTSPNSAVASAKTFRR